MLQEAAHLSLACDDITRQLRSSNLEFLRKLHRLAASSIDINFSKCKPKGERKIVYKDFLEAVPLRDLC